ncbi:hypothetical protein [Pseudomonas lundensis]|uniref:hypothetical protein n=1 Tax=Pseudomonas lundensis TaxID=86185 RepID=UPI000BA22F1F|nr:hypothetical protein [Pseudomonas lundensis]OZY46426.1 hypothetical protein CJF41_09940 [Pseudomonas lundensis]
MRPRLPLILLFMAVPLWLAAGYGLRYGLMEDPQWVGTCVAEATRWECQLRANLGLLIHFRVLGWAAIATAVVAFFVRGRLGRALAVLASVFGLPALALYNASLAVFAVVIAGLRLVRAKRV